MTELAGQKVPLVGWDQQKRGPTVELVHNRFGQGCIVGHGNVYPLLQAFELSKIVLECDDRHTGRQAAYYFGPGARTENKGGIQFVAGRVIFSEHVRDLPRFLRTVVHRALPVRPFVMRGQ